VERRGIVAEGWYRHELSKTYHLPTLNLVLFKCGVTIRGRVTRHPIGGWKYCKKCLAAAMAGTDAPAHTHAKPRPSLPRKQLGRIRIVPQREAA
jgi:hypothetical protein